MSPQRTPPPVLGRTEHPHPPHAKIVATLGPASDSPAMLDRLIETGVNVFRLNFSHGNLDDQLTRLTRVRDAANGWGRPIGILGDLQGPKMRVSKVPDIDEGGGINLNTGDDVLFRPGITNAEPAPAGADHRAVFGSTFDELFTDVEPGQRVLINDGAIRMLAVDKKHRKELRCRVTHGGRVTSSKGINLPESTLTVPAITPGDWKCVEWGVQHGVDFFALSFVRTAEEVNLLKQRLAGMCSINRRNNPTDTRTQIPVISKIEKPQALQNLDEIIRASDGLMVARGDLGVEMDVAQVPAWQKHIVARAAEFGKPTIVATQMLETMIESVSPTRAEASDVANAIFDGADAVMLSGETAVGAHPDVVVETMVRIIRAAEDRIDQLPHDPVLPDYLEEYPFRSAALAAGAWQVAQRSDAKLVVVWSQTGGMARYLSQHDFRIPILAFSSSDVATRRMTLLAGVTPICIDPPEDGMLTTWTEQVEAMLLANGWAEQGDRVIMVAGKPLGGIDGQDILAILRMGDPASGFRSGDHT